MIRCAAQLRPESPRWQDARPMSRADPDGGCAHHAVPQKAVMGVGQILSPAAPLELTPLGARLQPVSLLSEVRGAPVLGGTFPRPGASLGGLLAALPASLEPCQRERDEGGFLSADGLGKPPPSHRPGLHWLCPWLNKDLSEGAPWGQGALGTQVLGWPGGHFLRPVGGSEQRVVQGG